MDTIPEELLERWAKKDDPHTSPKLPVIDLLEKNTSPPELDFLDESSDCPSNTECTSFHGVESHPSPWIDPLKLHGTQSVVPGTISIATYASKKFSKTDRHA